MKKGVVLPAFVACFVAGFLLGRSGRPAVTEVRYERQETLSGHYGAPDLIPERSELPERMELPTVPEVVWTEGEPTVVQRVDTPRIIADYALLHHYSKLLFDNGDGRLTVNAGTQYNRLAYLDYEFTPLREVRTVVKEGTWTPFVSAGYSTNRYLSVGAGVFYRRVGVEYMYSRSFRRHEDCHSFFLKYRF